MISYFFASNQDKNQQRILHVSKSLLADEEYNFEIKEIITIIAAKPILDLSSYVNEQHIVWVKNEEEIDVIVDKLEATGISKNNIKIILVGDDSKSKKVSCLKKNDFYVSEVKYRKKNIIDSNKRYYITEYNEITHSKISLFKSRITSSLKRRLYKYLPQLRKVKPVGKNFKIDEKEFLELISPEKSYVEFGKIDTTGIDNTRLEISATLSGLVVISNTEVKDRAEILSLNKQMKKQCIDTLLDVSDESK